MRIAKLVVVSLVAVALITALSPTSANAWVEGLRVSTPDTCWYPGNFIDLPVLLEWTEWSKFERCEKEYWVPPMFDPAPNTPFSQQCIDSTGADEEICAFQMELRYDPDVIQAVTVTNGEGTLVDQWNWPALYFEIDNDRGILRIAGASADCEDITDLEDPSVLLTIGFYMIGRPGEDGDLEVTSFVYNEVDPIFIYYYNDDYGSMNEYTGAKSIGDLMVCEHEYVSGRIWYANNELPVCGVDVTLTYHPDPDVLVPPIIPDVTVQNHCENLCEDDCRGSYFIGDITDGYDYSIWGWKDDEYDDAITAFDASLVLRYIVGQIDLRFHQMVAADVSGNCEVNAYDASLILKHIVGDLEDQPYFPKKADEETNWLFYPVESGEVLCIEEAYWHMPLKSSYRSQDFVAVVLGDVSGNWNLNRVTPGSKTGASAFRMESVNASQLVLRADSDEVYGVQFEMTVPEGRHDRITVLPGADGWTVVQKQQGNTISVAAAGAEPITDGALARFELSGSVENLEIDELVINETVVAGHVSATSILPSQFSLLQNYPNPFNPSTTISFTVPVKTSFTLGIYNVTGQLVSEYSGVAVPGEVKEIEWEADDFATGIYFYRLDAGPFSDSRKMILLK